MSTEIKLVALLVGLLGIAAGAWWLADSNYASGHAAGAAETQVLWDEDKAAIAQVSAAALAAVVKERDTALEANEVINATYQRELTSVSADAAEFASRLRNAQYRLAAGSGAVPGATGEPGGARAGAPTSASQLGELAQLTADLHAEATANADQLDALVAQINAQHPLLPQPVKQEPP